MFKSKIKQNNNLKQNFTAGFSLVEMLVAIAIFMSIMTVAISSLISIINATKRAQAIKTTIDSVTFALESISRDMRTGYGYQCMTSTGLPITGTNDCSSGSPVVKYTVGDGSKDIRYMFSTTSVNGVILSSLVRSSSVCNLGAYMCPEDLISKDSNVNITSMNFYVIGADHELDTNLLTKTQPRVVITASGLIASKGSTDTTFNLQTNISQRVRR